MSGSFPAGVSAAWLSTCSCSSAKPVEQNDTAGHVRGVVLFLQSAVLSMQQLIVANMGGSTTVPSRCLLVAPCFSSCLQSMCQCCCGSRVRRVRCVTELHVQPGIQASHNNAACCWLQVITRILQSSSAQRRAFCEPQNIACCPLLAPRPTASSPQLLAAQAGPRRFWQCPATEFVSSEQSGLPAAQLPSCWKLLAGSRVGAMGDTVKHRQWMLMSTAGSTGVRPYSGGCCDSKRLQDVCREGCHTAKHVSYHSRCARSGCLHIADHETACRWTLPGMTCPSGTCLSKRRMIDAACLIPQSCCMLSCILV